MEAYKKHATDARIQIQQDLTVKVDIRNIRVAETLVK